MPTKTLAFKKDEVRKRLIWAEVYAPDRPDSDGEFMRAPEIEKMAYKFMKSKQLEAIDTQHTQINEDGCCVVESFIARKGDPDFIEGSWVVAIHVDNDVLWEQVEKGEINGLSMEALVVREPQEVEMEVPPILSGVTQKSEDHEHEFLVSYSPEGVFKGGRTTTVDGHYHDIKRGTITEEVNGHTHRFSHVEGLHIKN